MLVVRLAAVENAANEALIEFLSEITNVPPRAVRILSGTKSRQKRIAIDGITALKMSACLPIS